MVFNTTIGVALPVMTAFWFVFGLLGGIIPCFTKSPNKSTISIALVTTAVCCYLFWLLCFLAQLNPLVSPDISLEIVGHIREFWPGSHSPDGSIASGCYPTWN